MRSCLPTNITSSCLKKQTNPEFLKNSDFKQPTSPTVHVVKDQCSLFSFQLHLVKKSWGILLSFSFRMHQNERNIARFRFYFCLTALKLTYWLYSFWVQPNISALLWAFITLIYSDAYQGMPYRPRLTRLLRRSCTFLDQLCNLFLDISKITAAIR